MCVTETDAYAVGAAREGISKFRNANTKSLEVNVQLDQKRLSKWVSPLEGVHGGEEEAQRVSCFAVVWSALEILNEHSRRDVETEGNKGVHLPNQLAGCFTQFQAFFQYHTDERSRCEIILMMLAISFAAVIQRTLLSELTEAGRRFLSALKMAAWCKQMVEVWMHMFVNTTLGLPRPFGNFSDDGKHNEVLSSILSICLCRFQNSPFRSSSRSSALGRCRCIKFRPNKQAMSTTLPNGDSLPAPAGVMASSSVDVCSVRLSSNASSEAGRFVEMSFSSIIRGQPVPMLAKRSRQKAIQNVLLRSSLSVQSRAGGRHCLTSRPAPSTR